MLYDDYLDLSGMDLVPFIEPGDPLKKVNRVVYKIMDCKHTVLDMWMKSECDGFYLYMLLYDLEVGGYYFGITPSVKKRVKITEKRRRGSKASYYEAGMKAAIFAKDIVNTCLPDVQVNWKKCYSWNKAMSEEPRIAIYFECRDTEYYFFDEEKIWNS